MKLSHLPALLGGSYGVAMARPNKPHLLPNTPSFVTPPTYGSNHATREKHKTVLDKQAKQDLLSQAQAEYARLEAQLNELRKTGADDPTHPSYQDYKTLHQRLMDLALQMAELQGYHIA